jgi:short-subunit dehydrogenase
VWASTRRIARDLDVLAQTFATNNVGLAATFHPFVRAMAQRGSGRLVGIGSVARSAGCRGTARTAPARPAWSRTARACAASCASGVKVVTLCPGYIDTPLTQGNRYGMPFLMKAEDFAEQALRTIEVGTSYRVIPWQMGVVAKLMRMLPNAVLDRAVQGRERKKRSGEPKAEAAGWAGAQA